MLKKMMLILVIALCIPVVALAAGTETVYLNVGETKYLSAGSPAQGVVKGYAWTTSDPIAVCIADGVSSSTCKIQIEKYTSSQVVVHCLMYTTITVGGMNYASKDFKDFNIVISQPRYNVTLDASGGSVSPSMLTVYGGSTYGSLPTPVRSGYTFAGWYTSSGVKVTASSKTVDGNHVLTARWTENAYTIRFNGNGSDSGSMPDMSCKTGQSYSLASNKYTRSGRVFSGWNTRADGSGTQYANGESVRDIANPGATITLYAIWISANKQIPQCELTLAGASYQYDGGEKKPGVTVRDGRTTLTQGKDYKLEYRDNVNAGTARVVITGIGDYSASKTLNFEIGKTSQILSASFDAEYINVGARASISASGIGTISYKSNNAYASVDSKGVVTGVSKGTANITVTASGNQNYNSASKTLTISIETNYGKEVCGPKIDWTLSGGVLTLKGSGAMFDWPRTEKIFGTCDAPWSDRRGEVRSVVIADGITSIGEKAFAGCTMLKEIVIPDSVTTIGRDAFSGCAALETMSLPFVGSGRGATGSAGLFGYIFGSASYEGGQGVRQYYSSSGSTTWYIPSGLRRVAVTGATQLSYGTFYGCAMLNEVTLPATLSVIGASAFDGCTGLTTLPMADGVTSIGANAFNNCTGIKLANVPVGVKSIGSGAFNNCTGLMGVYITDMEKWVGIAFGSANANPLYYAGKLYLNGRLATDVIVGSSVGDYAFYNANVIGNATVGKGASSIGKAAFAGCTALEYVMVSEGVVTMGEGAFAGCASLNSITLPFIGASRTATGQSGVLGYLFGTDVFEKGQKIQQYYASSSSIQRYIPSGLKRVVVTDARQLSYGAFDNCSMLTEVKLSDSLTSIGTYACYNCSAIREIRVPSSVISVGKEAFNKCTGLTGVYIDDLSAWCAIEFESRAANPLYCAHQLYVGERQLTEFKIPGNVSRIGNYAFAGLEGIGKLEIPRTVTSIGKGAFYGWNALTDLSLPFVGANRGARDASGLLGHIFDYETSSAANTTQQQYSDKGFSYCYIPNTLKHVTVTEADVIPAGAFSKCSGITQIDIPAQTSVIGAYAFRNCSALTTLPLTGNLRTIGDYAFADCAITKVVIPATVEEIGSSAFYNCSKLTRVDITDMPAWCNIAFADASANPISTKTKLYLNGKQITTLSITSDYARIGQYAFDNLTSLTSLTINAPISEIGQYAFSGCTALKTLNAKASPQKIGEYAFSGCKALTKIVLPDGLKSIGKRAFEKCSVATEISIPVSTETIALRAFAGCNNVKTLTIPFIGESRSSGLTLGAIFESSSDTGSIIQYSGPHPQHKGEYYIPKTLVTVTVTDDTQLGYGDFYNCTMIKTVKLNCLVESFGERCFEGCTLTVNAPSCMDKSLAKNYGGKKITWKYYAATSMMDAELAPIEDQEYSWPEVRPTVVLTLDGQALVDGKEYSVEYSKNDGVGTAQVTVRGVGQYIGVLKTTFRINRKSLRSAVVSGIKDQHYSGAPLSSACTATLGDVTLLENRDYILERLITMDGNACVRITGIGNYKDVIQLPYRVFYGDVLKLPPALTEIGSEAFEGSGAEYIVIPDTCRAIGSGAFANCGHLFRIWIPASVKTIEEDAFPDCGNDLVIIAPAGSRAYEFAITKGYGYESAVEAIP